MTPAGYMAKRVQTPVGFHADGVLDVCIRSHSLSTVARFPLTITSSASNRASALRANQPRQKSINPGLPFSSLRRADHPGQAFAKIFVIPRVV
jgi:hypothetical protein